MISIWPTINASLNLMSFLCLLCGFRFIRKGERKRHQYCMSGAMAASILFLASYVAYHFNVGSRSFQGEGFVRLVYFAVLISHTVLAMGVAPLATLTIVRAIRGNFETHRGIARWTLPLWLYVSLTGVLIYLMLYILWP